MQGGLVRTKRTNPGRVLARAPHAGLLHTGPSATASPAQDSARRDSAQVYPADGLDLELGETDRLDIALNGLRRARPGMSSDILTTRFQRNAGAALAALALALWIAAPRLAEPLAIAILALPFSFITLLRLAALWRLAGQGAQHSVVRIGAASGTASDDDVRYSPMPPEPSPLPPYTLIVPLYREAGVAAKLIEALARLDYPVDRLQILLVTEADDEATRAALHSSDLARNMRVLAVPAGEPRTKPRALNYALTFATGEIVAVYDAEDVPDPDQLKMAAHAFQTSFGNLGCVQARLDIYNPADTFFTRQFTLEYAALFFAMLPAYERLGLPLPLGGTSNHFSRAILEHAGGWDAFNVTEDADLGLRLARLGFKVSVLPSDTWEEAPATAAQWFGQRTRWIKGWMQTYLVHMRSPARLLRDLGPMAFLGFQMIFGGLILSALMHPVFYAILAYQFAQHGPLLPSIHSGWQAAMWALCAFNVVTSYVCAIALGAVCARQRAKGWLVRSTLGLPVYWLMISGAAYMALAELIRRPHHWAKTAHTGAGRDSLRASSRHEADREA